MKPRVFTPRVIVPVITGGRHNGSGNFFERALAGRLHLPVEEMIKPIKTRVFTIRSMSGELRNEKRRDATQRDSSPSPRSSFMAFCLQKYNKHEREAFLACESS